jgi:hypothetical protein
MWSKRHLAHLAQSLASSSRSMRPGRDVVKTVNLKIE